MTSLKKIVSHGFTIVELLIVIVVIAILAGLSYVGYTNINNRTYDTAVKTDLSNAAKLLEVLKVDLGRYPRAQATDFSTSFKFSKQSYSTSGNHVMYCVVHDSDEYALTAVSKSGNRYTLTRQGVQFGGSSDPCTNIGATWGSSTPARTAVHGYFPTGTEPAYTNGWNNYWTWTD